MSLSSCFSQSILFNFIHHWFWRQGLYGACCPWALCRLGLVCLCATTPGSGVFKRNYVSECFEYMCLHYVYVWVPMETRREFQISRNGVTTHCKPLCGAGNRNQVLWENSQSLNHHSSFFYLDFFLLAGSYRQLSLKARDCCFVLGPNSGSAQNQEDSEQEEPGRLRTRKSISSYQLSFMVHSMKNPFIGSDLRWAAKPYSRFPYFC